ncbi:hypothetical protein GE21DRAFT_1212876 [Neurospora crassa]|nr:hypothetical protein B1D1.320 [imported] - Neurospora crassa [Neurospora crassa]KHE82694.1 hypothetical protein GE21DRAFT_1212876 [Neurospora crassa]
MTQASLEQLKPLSPSKGFSCPRQAVNRKNDGDCVGACDVQSQSCNVARPLEAGVRLWTPAAVHAARATLEAKKKTCSTYPQSGSLPWVCFTVGGFSFSADVFGRNPIGLSPHEFPGLASREPFLSLVFVWFLEEVE